MHRIRNTLVAARCKVLQQVLGPGFGYPEFSDVFIVLFSSDKHLLFNVVMVTFPHSPLPVPVSHAGQGTKETDKLSALPSPVCRTRTLQQVLKTWKQCFNLRHFKANVHNRFFDIFFNQKFQKNPGIIGIHVTSNLSLGVSPKFSRQSLRPPTDPRLDVTARLDTKEVGGGSGREAWCWPHAPKVEI